MHSYFDIIRVNYLNILTSQISISCDFEGFRAEARVSPSISDAGVPKCAFLSIQAHISIIANLSRRMAQVVYATVSEDAKIQGTLFDGKKFWLSQKVPMRSSFIQQVKVSKPLSIVTSSADGLLGQRGRSCSSRESRRHQNSRSYKERDSTRNVRYYDVPIFVTAR